MPFTQPWFEVAFGNSQTGLSTVGYRLYKNDGTDSVARTTSGVIEVGYGVYGAPSVSVPDNAVGIEWDTGGTPLYYATEDVEPYRKAALGSGDFIVDGSLTLTQTQKIILAALAGLASGGGSTSIAFRDVGNTKDVLVMTVDENGNRSVVTLTP